MAYLILSYLENTGYFPCFQLIKENAHLLLSISKTSLHNNYYSLLSEPRLHLLPTQVPNMDPSSSELFKGRVISAWMHHHRG